MFSCVCGNLLERLTDVECIQKKLPSGLCGNRTLVGETTKRTNTDLRANKHNYTKIKRKTQI